MLARRRAAQPVPMLYLVVGAVGALIGLALRRLTGLRWWIAPLALVGAAWTFFFSSIWWKPRLHSTRLSTELLSIIDPRRGGMRRRQEHIARLMDSDLPMLGFNGLERGPTIGGMSWSGDGLHQVTIRYSDEFQIQITDATHAWEDAGQTSARELLESSRMNRILDGADTPEERNALLDRANIGDTELEWSETVLDVGGEKLPASQTTSDGLTAAYARLGGCWISVLAPTRSERPALRALDDGERKRLAESGQLL